MTLKEKFSQFTKKEIWEKENHNAEECELISDDYAIEFAYWLTDARNKNVKESITIENLLEVFKKEKEL